MKSLMLLLVLFAPQTTVHNVSTPTNIHEYAMREISKSCQQRNPSADKVYIPEAKTGALEVGFKFPTPLTQGFLIKCDGEVELQNMSEHDALLFLAAEILRKEFRKESQ